MSEQVRKQSIEQIPTGQNDLSGLSASKDLHQKVDKLPCNASDLASASISSSSFVRTSTQGGSRLDSLRHSSSLERTHAPEQKIPTSTSKNTSTAAPGVFKNPTYPYRGGLASKIITFLANVLKALERIFLRLLGARDTVAPTPRHQQLATRQSERKDRKQSKHDESEREAQVITRS